MLDITTIGTLIARHRNDLRLTQTDLAARARIGRSTLDALENGRIAELGFGKISRVLAALGLTLKITDSNNGRPTLDDLREDADDLA
jgi:transcriptional regulator with XRE-family HTH domain